jgi:hypothetical protein
MVPKVVTNSYFSNCLQLKQFVLRSSWAVEVAGSSEFRVELRIFRIYGSSSKWNCSKLAEMRCSNWEGMEGWAVLK